MRVIRSRRTSACTLPTYPGDPYGWPAVALELKMRKQIGDLSSAAKDQFYTIYQ